MRAFVFTETVLCPSVASGADWVIPFLVPCQLPVPREYIPFPVPPLAVLFELFRRGEIHGFKLYRGGGRLVGVLPAHWGVLVIGAGARYNEDEEAGKGTALKDHNNAGEKCDAL